MFFSSSTMRTVAMGDRSSLPPGELEREAAAPPDLALEEDASAVRLHDVAHDGEPETGGTRLAAVLPLHEALEDALALLGRNAGTGVRDAHPDDPVLRAGADRDLAAARRVPQPVRDQVRQRPEDLRGVARDAQIARRHDRLERDPALARLECEDAGAARDDVAEMHVLPLERDAHRARARHVEEPLRHVLEAFHVLAGRLDELGALGVERRAAALE